jgi:serine/threonine protein kinase/Tfp pilus assembly protein PilF
LTARTRFRREAELLASLNHPNIAVIHDIIEQDDHSGYLVLEYIEGETLAERIAREPLSIKEALSIGQQVAEAISAAHKKGIIHRDLKPGNIKITPEGRVKVLDFGLAKTYDRNSKGSDTAAIQPGRVIGTPAYMSPEQACGKEADHRTDIWSFGCVMYQMLTGQLPFEGETATDTLAHIIECQPDWGLLPKSTPAKIRTLLYCCLEKDPDKRLGDIADAALEIYETLNKQPQPLPVRLRKAAMIICATVVVTLLGVAMWFVPTSSNDIRLAVLPFENLGIAEEEYFADGITEEIMSRLSAIHTLDVISRTSSMQYKNTNKTIQKIGEELDVEYVLEGTVRWERLPEGSDRVRVIPQLIRVSDDTHLWSERYDAVLANIIQVQSDMAEQITRALDITLLERERQALVYKPTENTEAYLYYLQGNKYYHRRYVESDLSNAIQMYKKAIELDLNFAQAYSQLSRAHTMMFWHYDHSDSRLVLAQEAVEKALQLNPDLPEAHLALGQYYFQGLRDYESANKELEIARKNLPISSEVLYFTGLVQGRQGKFEQALANIKRAYEVDPLSNNIAIEIGLYSMFLRKYAQAETYCKRAIFLAPDSPKAYNVLSQIYPRWNRNIEKARDVLDEALKKAKGAEYPGIIQSLVNLDIYDRNYQEALEHFSLVSQDVDEAGFFFPKALRFAQIYEYINNMDLAKKYYNDTLIFLESKIKEQPENPQFHSLLGIVYAGLGNKEKAIQEGMRAVEILPIRKEAVHGSFLVKNLALIYCMVGKYDPAIDKLEYLLSIPGGISTSLLQLDPAWNPLRNHPRFKKLIDTYK